MTAPATGEDLARRLEQERIVALAKDEWLAVASTFPVEERHATGLRGDLWIVQTNAGLAAVEEPTPDQRVVRLLGSPDDASRFIADRLASYERMWDGCGCRIDYYS
jgi:hypothetical protein